jgi:hypothetical protein
MPDCPCCANRARTDAARRAREPRSASVSGMPACHLGLVGFGVVVVAFGEGPAGGFGEFACEIGLAGTAYAHDDDDHLLHLCRWDRAWLHRIGNLRGPFVAGVEATTLPSGPMSVVERVWVMVPLASLVRPTSNHWAMGAAGFAGNGEIPVGEGFGSGAAHVGFAIALEAAGVSPSGSKLAQSRWVLRVERGVGASDFSSTAKLRVTRGQKSGSGQRV